MSHCIGEILAQCGLLEQVLEKIDHDFEFVFDVLKKLISPNIHTIPVFMKSEERSQVYRTHGNKAFYAQDYNNALCLYNLAIMNASDNSYSLALAYSNRSAVLLKMKKITECIHDINICLNLPCGDLSQKLKDRKDLCKESISMSSGVSCGCKTAHTEVCGNIFNSITGERHKTIKNASDAIRIDNDKIIASRDVELGEVIIIETAYVSALKNSEVPLCCHRCNKFSFNLIPCKFCSFAMYCNEKCRQASWEELHQLECRLSCSGVLNDWTFRVCTQAVLKTVIKSEAYEQLITAVKNVDKFKKGYEECLKHPLSSYLNICKRVTYDRLPKRGWLFNCAVNTAMVMHYLEPVVDSLLINEKTKKKTLMFIGKQIMFLCEQSSFRCLPAVININNLVSIDGNRCMGIFPLIKLLRHSCDPNVQCLGFENKLVVVTIKPVPKDTEFIMCYGKHFHTRQKHLRNRVLFLNYGIICKCIACRKDWQLETLEVSKEKLTPAQEDFVRNLNLYDLPEEIVDVKSTLTSAEKKRAKALIRNAQGVIEDYDVICKGLTLFSGDTKSAYFHYFNRMLTIYFNRQYVRLINQDVIGMHDPYGYDEDKINRESQKYKILQGD